MARLQILELPEAESDRRPPIVLVVDQQEPHRFAVGPNGSDPWRAQWEELADKIGARGVIVTAETVEIPANDVSVFRTDVAADEPFVPDVSGAIARLTTVHDEADGAEGRSRAMEVQRDRAAHRAERAEAGHVAADNMLRAVCEVFGGPDRDPVVKARETLARAKGAEDKLRAFAEAQHHELVDRMDEITDALGFDRLRDWDEIVSAIKRQRQIEVDGGHRFLAVPERDGERRCSVCGVTRDLWADLPGTPTCAAIKERGYY